MGGRIINSSADGTRASLDAYDYYQRGLAVINRTITRSVTTDALLLFKEALARDPEFALAHAWVARCYSLRKINGWMADRAEENAEAILHADNDIYIALIDGQGAEPQERDQQFEIADQSDVLVIVLDHNDSDVSCNIDGARRGAHNTFLQQLKDRFKAREVRGDKRKLMAIFVLNKEDLWSQANDSEFTSWFQTHVQGWSGEGISVGEASMEMSAKEPRAIEELKRKIVTAARQLKT